MDHAPPHAGGTWDLEQEAGLSRDPGADVATRGETLLPAAWRAKARHPDLARELCLHVCMPRAVNQPRDVLPWGVLLLSWSTVLVPGRCASTALS